MRFKIVLITITLFFSSTLIAPSAQATTKGWRYWGYFQAAPGKTAWTAAMTGPAVDVADGSVEGWSFVFSSDDIPSKAPSIKPSFKSICAKTPADNDTKRIGLVIDFGSTVYAPKGDKVNKTIATCVRVAKESLGIDVLAQVAKIRASKSGLICGINGFPSKECGVEIPTPTALKSKK